MDKYAKKNVSTKQSTSCEEARVSLANEHSRRSKCNQAETIEGSQAFDAVSLLGFRLPKENKIRKRGEFQEVYAKGIRLRGRFMTAFVMASKTSFHRIGITASRKAIGNSVMRNRAKRLLREAFRLSSFELSELEANYDWVLNARKDILDIKMEESLEEFRELISKIKLIESSKGGVDHEVCDD